MKKIPVILDVDTGTDDAVAILCAALSPKIDLLALTVASGNQPLKNTVDNTLRIVELSGKDIPVYAGCPEPMVRNLMPGRALDVRMQTVEKTINGEHISIHEPHLPLPAPKTKAQEQHACSYLVETLRSTKEKITIIAVAPLTNIGMALRMAPEIAHNIEELVIMGGSVNGGNRTPAAEANFFDDPEAAQIVLKSGIPMRIFTLEATEIVECDHKDANEFRKLGKVGEFVGDLIDGFIHRCTLLDICPNQAVAIHDAITVCGVIDPDMVTNQQKNACDICLSGWADGKLVVDRRNFASANEPVSIVYDIDKVRCLQAMKNSLEGKI
ncbi:nucleoside hydrolase [Oscillospiraceae bacterium MB08-C2-2]|nr:nucleoside hydrolase [Oscillospiraceae bacterium MB08-C2-2]